MKIDLTSIPIEEVFEPHDGCPLCRLREILENRTVEYIIGPAMMEPDIRIETNKVGFCDHHFDLMLQKRNKLSVALMLESHLQSINKRIFGGLPKDATKKSKIASEIVESCYICNSIEKNMEQMLANTCAIWEKSKDFRQLYSEQPKLCLPHYSQLLEAASHSISKKNRSDFIKATTSLAEKEITVLQEDISHFTKMFDYRNSGENADWKNSKDAIERSVHFLTGNIPK